MDILLSQYGNVRTKPIYACELKLCFRWLKQKGIPLTPEGLVQDNLLCAYRSDSTDVRTKKRHTDWLNAQMKRTAERLMRQCLTGEYPLASWHSHAVRHSFETEASHAGVEAEIRDFFLGHIGGIQWVCNHGDSSMRTTS